MRLELFISWRYLTTKRKEKFIWLISGISVIGVAIGVAALIIVIGVMAGFDQDLHEKIVGNSSHITLVSYKAIEQAELEIIREKALANKEVCGVAAYLQGQVLARQSNRFFAIDLRGIDPKNEPSVTKISQYLVSGRLDDLSAQTAIVGKELANYLGIFPDSQILIYSPTGKQHLLKVVGIFSSGMYDYDMKLAFCNLQTAQEILGFANQVTAVGIRVAKPYLAGRVRDELAKELDFNYNLKTWMEVNQNFFAALKLEKLTMFIILALIILVAAFNIASSLIVMVVEKTKDIGILRAQGMTSGDIRRIFTLHGLLIGGTGTLFGFGIGLALCWLLEKYQFVKLPQDVYYLDKIPVSLQPWPDLALIVGVAMLITLISTVYPANKAAGLKPVEALRYE